MWATWPRAAAVVAESASILDVEAAFGRWRPWMVNDKDFCSKGSIGYIHRISSQIRRVCPVIADFVDCRRSLREETFAWVDARWDCAFCWVRLPEAIAVRRVSRLAWRSDSRPCADLRCFRDVATYRLVDARLCSAWEEALKTSKDCFCSSKRLLICEVSFSRVASAS